MPGDQRQPEINLVKYRGVYAVAIGRGSQRRRLSTGTADRGLAQARAEQIYANMHAPASDRVSDLWQAYLGDRRKDGRDTARQQYAWKNLGPIFSGMLGEFVNKDHCRTYAASRAREGASPSTVKTELDYLRACLSLRYGKGRNQVWVPSASKPRDRFLSRAEVETLLSSVTAHHVRLFIILALSTGARMGALLELKWDQVDLKNRTIDFNGFGAEQTNKRRAVVPINSRAYVALKEAVRGALSDHVIEWDGAGIQSIKKAIRMAARRSDIECSPHVFRHTAGVWMAQADVPMQKIAQYLGHTSTRVTERVYARYSPAFMVDAAAALEF